MGEEYQTIGFLGVFMLSLVWLAGQGADEIVDFQSQGADINLTTDEREIDLQNEASSTNVYYDESAGGWKVNATKYEQNGETPRVEFEAGANEIQEIFIKVDYSVAEENFTRSSDAISYESSGLVEIPYDGLQVDYYGENPAVEWQNNALIGYNQVPNENYTLTEIRFITDPAQVDRDFVERIAALTRVTSGYSFFNDVIMPVIGLILAALLITLGARALPFF